MFTEFEEYLLGDRVSYLALVPLENFESEARTIVLEPGVVVRELSAGERERALTRVLSGSSFQTLMEVSRFRFAADIEVSWKKGGVQQHHQESVERLLTGLRLFKRGGVGANYAVRRENRWQPGNIVGGEERHIFTAPVAGPMYKLNQSEANALQEFWSWFYGRPHGGNLAVAIRWFNHGSRTGYQQTG